MSDPESRADALHAVVAFLAATLGWMFLSAISTAALANVLTGLPLEEAMQTPRMLALGALVQTSGLGLVALGLTRWFPVSLPRGASARSLGAGAAAGLTVGLLPGWIAAQLQRLGKVPSVLDALSTALQGAAPIDRVLLVVAICLVAPIAEEIAFRGVLWSAIEKGFGPLAALVTTTGVFMLYHLDPIQTPSLLPTALLLGVLRLWRGSLLPCIALHLANNAVAMVVLLAADPDRVPTIPLWLALGGTVVSWCLVALAGRLPHTVSP